MSKPFIQLNAGREKSVLLKHPWIFASAVAKVVGDPKNGETVLVLDSKEKILGKGSYSSQSQIRVRIWSWNPDEEIGYEFIKRKLIKAIDRRKLYKEQENTTAMRLVFGEADEIPGLIVDQYNQTLIVQILSAGPEFWREEIFRILDELVPCERIFERSDLDVRALEGLAERKGLIKGTQIDGDLIIVENRIRYKVDVENGQKTGFFIDQRRNREKIQHMVNGKDVLNCFCYTGGFTLNALMGGAKSVVSIDSSKDALNKLSENITLNKLDINKSEILCGDVFKLLRLFRDQGKSFDMIILDPPKFAPTISQAEKAARGYKDINLLAFKLLKPGGILVTFSCSGGISRDLFQKIVTGAAFDAGVDAKIFDFLSQGPDHPVALNFPESFYLKGLICVK
jgi:23S rRNA (cytosine1962-C5)-methyltransferase